LALALVLVLVGNMLLPPLVAALIGQRYKSLATAIATATHCLSDSGVLAQGFGPELADHAHSKHLQPFTRRLQLKLMAICQISLGRAHLTPQFEFGAVAIILISFRAMA